MEEKRYTITAATLWIAVFTLVIGFIAGSEWQKYQVRRTAAEAVSAMQSALAVLSIEVGNAGVAS